MLFVCSAGYRSFLQSVQCHIAELQKCPTTSARAAAAAVSRSNSITSQADVSAAAGTTTAATVDNVQVPARLDSKGNRRPELDSASEMPIESRTESDSRCLIS